MPATDPTGPEDTGPEPPPPPRLPLSRRARAWRAAALTAGVLLIAHGSLTGNDVQWPFAPMSQFAFRIGHDDAIHATCLQAVTPDGVVPISLSAASVGIARAEIEGQLPAFERDPELLGDLASAYARLHPSAAPLRELRLCDRVTELHDGRAAGEHVDTLIVWRAPAGDGS